MNGTQNGSGLVTIASSPSQIYVTDYVNAFGKPVHLVQTGTTGILFIDSLGHIALGTFSSPTTASTPYYPNDVVTVSLDTATVNWSDGTVWTRTAPTTAITVTNYTNSYGVPVHLVQDGVTQSGGIIQVAFVDSLGRTSLGTMQSPTTMLADLYPGDLATISGNTVSWQDGSLWTQTNALPLMISLLDTNNAVSHAQLTNASTLIVLGPGPLQNLTAMRLNGKLFWSNGMVWDNFDFNTLNALFEMATGYP
jgi:hypothetical protein